MAAQRFTEVPRKLHTVFHKAAQSEMQFRTMEAADFTARRSRMRHALLRVEDETLDVVEAYRDETRAPEFPDFAFQIVH